MDQESRSRRSTGSLVLMRRVIASRNAPPEASVRFISSVASLVSPPATLGRADISFFVVYRVKAQYLAST